ncbi:hypothetical protein ES705_29772 [subsurface metagenome]
MGGNNPGNQQIAGNYQLVYNGERFQKCSKVTEHFTKILRIKLTMFYKILNRLYTPIEFFFRFEFIKSFFLERNRGLPHHKHIKFIRVIAKYRVCFQYFLSFCVPLGPLSCGKNRGHQFGFDFFHIRHIVKTAD